MSKKNDGKEFEDPESRRVVKRKRVEKQWRKGTSRWRYAGDPEEIGDDGPRKSSPRKYAVVTPENERDALVIQTGGPVSVLQDGDEELRARPRRSTTTENPDTTLIAVGDRVRYIDPGVGDAVVTHIYARRSELLRSAVNVRDYPQVLVANIDQLVITVAATEEMLRPGLIDRYLIAAAMGGITPLVCINKMDLVDEEGFTIVEEVAGVYRSIGYAVLYTSCVTGEGIGQLHNALKDRLSAFAGHSGVGKTSLLLALLPELDLKIQEVSEQSRRGTHTTSKSTLYELPEGGYIADTPGIREFGLYHFERGELHTYYPEFLPFADQCRFPNCTHISEPDCAVMDAVEEGLITSLRYRNYLQIMESEEG